MPLPDGHPQLDEQTRELLNRQLDRHGAVVSRLANNSVQVKTWCLTATAALAALAVNNHQPELLWLGVPVVVAFLWLDAYYLALERGFRRRAKALATEITDGGVAWPALVVIEKPTEATSWQSVLHSMRSAATWPFYGGVAAILAVGYLVLR